MDRDTNQTNQNEISKTFTNFFRRVISCCICFQINANFEEMNNTPPPLETKHKKGESMKTLQPIDINDYIDIHNLDEQFKKLTAQTYESNNELNNKENLDGTQNDNNESNFDEETEENQTEDKNYPVLDSTEVQHILSSRHLPVTPTMVTTKQRLDSFHDNKWLLKGIYSPNNMAEAGFFCVGIGEQAECHFCSLRINVWTEHPSVEHITLSPRCHYIRNTYSEEYINYVLFQRAVEDIKDYGFNNGSMYRL